LARYCNKTKWILAAEDSYEINPIDTFVCKLCGSTVLSGCGMKLPASCPHNKPENLKEKIYREAIKGLVKEIRDCKCRELKKKRTSRSFPGTIRVEVPVC
jgi:hypothetical protein